MPRPKPWLKMWAEWIHDPKMLSLNLAERGAWWALVTLAQQCMAEGKIVSGDGSPISLEDIAQCLHIQRKEDMKILQSMITKMEDKGSLTWNGHALTVIHLTERQETAPSDTKEAIRDRVQRYRERRTVTEKPLQQVKKREPEKKDKDIYKRERERCNGVTSVTSPKQSTIEQTQNNQIVTGKPLHPNQKSGEKSENISQKRKTVFHDNVLLTTEEHQKLVQTFGADETDDRIQNLSLYMRSKGKSYKDHYATILNWERMDRKRGKAATPQKRVGKLPTTEELESQAREKGLL